MTLWIKETVTISILPDIFRSKGNQIMRFGQLIKIFFFKNHVENAVKKLVPDSFLKNQN